MRRPHCRDWTKSRRLVGQKPHGRFDAKQASDSPVSNWLVPIAGASRRVVGELKGLNNDGHNSDPARRGRAETPSGFRGWPSDAVEFLTGLEADNSKKYWHANKDAYDSKVLAPMVALLAELTEEFGEGHVFRPYRDLRFGLDKSPYKTNIAAMNDAGYISLSAHTFSLGSGLHMPSSDQLARFRSAVADDTTGPGLMSVVAAIRRKDIRIIAQEMLKSAPRGYPNNHARIDLLRYKDLLAWKEWPVGAWLGTVAPKQRIISFLRATEPLRVWLAANVYS